MNVSTTTKNAAYCSRSRQGASIFDSIIIVIIFNSSSSSSSPEDVDCYSDHRYSNDWDSND